MNLPPSATSLRRYGRRLTVALLSGLLVIAMTSVPAAADVSFINSRRASAGLPAVTSSGGLASIAASHSRSMMESNRLFHSSGLGSKVSSVLPGWIAVGENVGVGASVSDVNSMFMQSSAHRGNILGNYTHAGVGVVTGPDGRVWVTQVFARMPSGGTVAAAASPAPRASSGTRAAAPRTVRPRASRYAASRPTVRATPEPEAPRPPAATTGFAPMGQSGYLIVADDGGVFTYGGARFAGSAADLPRNAPVVDAAPTPLGDGYVLFGSDGGVFTFGAARFIGSAAGTTLNAPVVSGDLTPSGEGYRLFGADGGVFTFGDAGFHGSLVGMALNAQVVSASSTPTGRGYVLVGRDGGVFAFGDAPFLGSLAGQRLNAPVVGVAVTRTGRGYWLVSADGGVFAFGDAAYLGGLVGTPLASPVVAIIPAQTGRGYWLVTADKQVTGFGDVDAPPALDDSAAPPAVLRRA